LSATLGAVHCFSISRSFGVTAEPPLASCGQRGFSRTGEAQLPRSLCSGSDHREARAGQTARTRRQENSPTTRMWRSPPVVKEAAPRSAITHLLQRLAVELCGAAGAGGSSGAATHPPPTSFARARAAASSVHALSQTKRRASCDQRSTTHTTRAQGSLPAINPSAGRENTAKDASHSRRRKYLISLAVRQPHLHQGARKNRHHPRPRHTVLHKLVRQVDEAAGQNASSNHRITPQRRSCRRQRHPPHA